MNEVCELVSSQKEKLKMYTRDYSMVKDKFRKNMFYWCYEKGNLWLTTV